MKIKLLVLSLLFLPFDFFAQVTAYPVPDINQCENAVFDLSQQTPIVLGNQGPWPSAYEVMYYTSQTGAQTGSSEGAISTMNYHNYTLVGDSQIIYIRVMRVSPSASAVTAFTIRNSYIPPMVGMPDIVACGPIILPPPAPGTSFNTGPNGTNPPVDNPFFFTMYVHNSNGYCSSDYPFTITRVPPGPYPVQDVSACTAYAIPYVDGAFYYNNPEGTGNYFAAGTPITSSMTLYAIPAGSNSCFQPNSFDVHIGTPEVNQPATPLYGCFADVAGQSTYDFHTKFFEIATAAGNIFSVHNSQLEAENNQNGIDYEQPLNITAPQTVYVRVSNGGNCYSVVTLDLIPETCTSNTIYGSINFNQDNNGCELSTIRAPYTEVIRTFGNRTFSTYTDIAGYYYFEGVQEGSNTLTTIVPANFSASPESQEVDLIGTESWVDAAPFCFSATGTFNDLEINLIPVGSPRPNGTLYYSMYFANKGTTVLSGSAVLQYDAARLTFVEAPPGSVQAPGTVTINFTDLQPFQIWGGSMHFTVNPQPAVVLGDVLTATASVTTSIDEDLQNNTAVVSQIVVNSYDPNDIIVHEGAFITPEQADDYLHYTIRFENVGTAEAIDVLIKNKLDDRLDWSTFTPLGSSAYGMRIGRSGADLEFRFDGINLPPNMDNDPDLVGYVSYKIKPLPGLTVGEVISNDAAIYFDDNAPILTNTVTTQIEATFGVVENEFDTLKIYPNPSQEVVSIDWKTNSKTIGVAIYDLQGKLILESNREMVSGKTSVDVSRIQTGIYLMKVTADGKSTVKKWVKL
ncbi:T9SS type A sorting domain-containing protein [Flavobacterium sp.]|uniref:T9SS type A sorting domain-containing protein n=1 Tax=Flavobacterium sp. TaxID=239 RepID=UPI0039E3819C